MRRAEPALSINPLPSSRLRRLVHARAWAWPVSLAVLMALTSIALAILVTAWLVPLYLTLVAWILFPASTEHSNVHEPVEEPSEPQQASEVSSNAVPTQAGDTAASEPQLEPSTEAESLVDEVESTEPVGLKNKRSRARGRKGKGFVEPPTNVTWIQVGPGKFVRVEPASPMVAHFSRARDAKPAEDATLPDPSVIENGPEALPPDPCIETTQVANEAPSVVEETEASVEVNLADAVAPSPTCEEALPPSKPELIAEAQLVEAKVFGHHLDEPHEVERVPDKSEESEAVENEAEKVAASEPPLADKMVDAQIDTGNEVEKLGIAPEASVSNPRVDLHAEPFEEASKDDQLETESEAFHEVSAEFVADRCFPAFFREPWFSSSFASWPVPRVSQTRRNARRGQSGVIPSGFRQYLRRNAGRSRQPCRTFSPRAPPRSLYQAQGRRFSLWEKGRPSLLF